MLAGKENRSILIVRCKHYSGGCRIMSGAGRKISRGISNIRLLEINFY